MGRGCANSDPDSSKAVLAEQMHDSVSARLRNAFQHDSASCSRRVVESRCGNLAGREIFPRRCVDHARRAPLLACDPYARQ